MFSHLTQTSTTPLLDHHTLEIVPKTRTCTPSSSSSPQGILVMEQRLDYTNVLFQDAQDSWKDFHSLLHTENSITLSQNQTLLLHRLQKKWLTLMKKPIWKLKLILIIDKFVVPKYEKDTGDVSLSHYPSTPWLQTRMGIFRFCFFKVCFNN